MRRLSRVFTSVILAAALLDSGCRARDKIRLEPTEEHAELSSTVHMADPDAGMQLLHGFHQVEQNSWRWTAGSFSVTLRRPSGADASGAELVVKLSVPDAVISRLGPVTLTASLDGEKLGDATWSSSGDYTFRADVPATALHSEAVTVDFTLDKFFAAGAVDSRELGLIVSSIGMESRQGAATFCSFDSFLPDATRYLLTSSKGSAIMAEIPRTNRLHGYIG